MATSMLNYQALITPEHNQRPKYMATIGATVQGAVDAQNLLSAFSGESTQIGVNLPTDGGFGVGGYGARGYGS